MVALAVLRSVDETVPNTWTRLYVEDEERTDPDAIHLKGSSDPKVSVSVAQPKLDEAVKKTTLLVEPLQLARPAPDTVVSDVVALAVNTPETFRYPDNVSLVPELLVKRKVVMVAEAERRSSAVNAPLMVEMVDEVDLKLLAVVFPRRLIVVVEMPILIVDEATEKYVAPRLLF